MAGYGTQEAVLRVKACRKEDESQKSAHGLASGDPRHAGISVWELFLSGDPQGRGKKKKKQKKSPAAPSRTSVVVVSYIRASRDSRRRP